MKKICVILMGLFLTNLLLSQNYAPYQGKKKKKIIRPATNEEIAYNVKGLQFQIDPQSKTRKYYMYDKGEDTVNIEVPAGLDITSKTKESESKTGAGATIGFSVFKNDSYYLAFYCSKSIQSVFKGSSEVFGGSVVNPSTEGLSFYTSWNVIIKKKPKANKNDDAITDEDSPKNLKFLFGFSGRFGCSINTWQIEEDLKVISKKCGIFHFDANFMLISKTIKTSSGNEFQGAIETGPCIRFLSDIDKTFLEKSAVLGCDRRSFLGWSGTISFRINKVRPYLRLMFFKKPKIGTEKISIPGLTESSVATIGVEILTPFLNDKTDEIK